MPTNPPRHWNETTTHTARLRKVRRGEALRAVAMPLGGLGAGSLALCGDGSLRQWQINNQINHLACVPHSFFALWAQPDQPGAATIARALQSSALYDSQGPLPPPTSNDQVLPSATRALLNELPGVAATEYIGEYPIAEVTFLDPALPVQVTLEAFSPFIPLDSKDSGLPAIFFNFHLTNPTDRAISVSLLASLQNIVGWDGVSAIEGTRNSGYGSNINALTYREGLTFIEMTTTRLPTGDEHFGSLALAAFADETTGLVQWADLGALWHDFADDGLLSGGHTNPSPIGQTWNGALAVPCLLGPGASRIISFTFTWHFPNRCFDYANGHYARLLRYTGPPDKFRLGNQYNNWFRSAAAVVDYVYANRERLIGQTRLARNTLYATTLPTALIEAVTSQMSVMRSPVCFWTEDGRFYGFEGGSGASTPLHISGGSCPLNCTHVWNYEMALARLFPALERTMRATEWLEQQHPDGWLPHRVPLPLDLPRLRDEYGFGGPRRAALDGLLGGILKTYREYRASGDVGWLTQMWPGVKKALAYIWTAYDPQQIGTIIGEQPNTYDISVYGLNSFIGTLYLAALRATQQMARLQGDEALVDTCRAIYERGRAALDGQLWNGEYYIQEVDLAQYPENNWATGCHADQLLGQWWARLLGLGDILPTDHLRGAAQAIFRHNFRQGFHGHQQQPRVFVTDEDHGLLNCTWPHGGRPAVPTPYSDEVWTGIEYEVAALLLYMDNPDAAISILEANRARYDGRKQNPWNDIECGDHYVRAMSAWALLEAAAGYDYDAGAQAIAFAPEISPKNFRAPFVTRDGWGTFVQSIVASQQTARLQLTYGTLSLGSLGLRVKGTLVSATLVMNDQQVPAVFSTSNDPVTATLDEVLTLRAGQTLEVTLRFAP